MKDFTKYIYLYSDFTPEFFFQELYTVSGSRFSVSVSDEKGKVYFFNMERHQNADWKIINAPKVPEWILSLESELHEAIIENLSYPFGETA